ncbi:MAG TPA: hypothetical protein EYN51_12365 [Flavobacteriales bacterium]|nr:hypothetical protein [Flavobacteriales bacterium]
MPSAWFGLRNTPCAAVLNWLYILLKIISEELSPLFIAIVGVL